MKINDPEILTEVQAAFETYESALLANDNATLDRFFLDDPRIVRYGLSDVQHGVEEIRRFRGTQSPFTRRLDRTVITTFGEDFATASTLFRREDCPGEIGRQMQTWMKMPDGWKIVAAHVSMMPAE